MSELVSVIMSTYNEKLEWIESSIDSILNQMNVELELIIILDNPLNTELKELLFNFQKRDDRIKVILNSVNLGLVKSLNIALKYCKGKYIARMDADDISIENRLFVEKKYLEENNLDFVFSNMIHMDESGIELYEMNNKDLTYLQIKKLLGITNVSNHPTWFIKKEVYENMHGYREIPYCEDYDFSLRCLNHGYKIGKVSNSLLKYRIRDTGISKSYSLEQFLNAREILALYNSEKMGNSSLIIEFINRNKKLASSKEKERYLKADMEFREGLGCIKKNNNIIGWIKILKSLFMSKYFFLKCYDMFRYKIKLLMLY